MRTEDLRKAINFLQKAGTQDFSYLVRNPLQDILWKELQHRIEANRKRLMEHVEGYVCGYLAWNQILGWELVSSDPDVIKSKLVRALQEHPRIGEVVPYLSLEMGTHGLLTVLFQDVLEAFRALIRKEDQKRHLNRIQNTKPILIRPFTRYVTKTKRDTRCAFCGNPNADRTAYSRWTGRVPICNSRCLKGWWVEVRQLWRWEQEDALEYDKEDVLEERTRKRAFMEVMGLSKIPA